MCRALNEHSASRQPHLGTNVRLSPLTLQSGRTGFGQLRPFTRLACMAEKVELRLARDGKWPLMAHARTRFAGLVLCVGHTQHPNH